MKWIFICFLIISNICKAQMPSAFQFKQIKDEEGLLGNVINCFLQDKDGFLWIGTYDGLKRYSGEHTDVFRTNRRDSTSICNNIVHDICEDKSGRIWFATNEGIAVFDKQKNSFRNISKFGKSPLSGCFNILCGSDGNIWFSSFWQGFFKYDVKNDKLEKIGQPLKNGIIQNGLVEDKINKGIWIGTTEGLYFYDFRKKSLFNYLKNPDNIEILTQNEAVALTLDQNQLIYADNVKGEIIFYDLIKNKITKTLKPESKIKQNSFDAATIFADKNHHLWFSTWNYSFFYIEPENNKIVQLFHDKSKPTSIASEFFWAGWQQKDGSIWIGTPAGISIHNPDRSFYNVHDISELYPDLDEEFGVISFAEDSSDGSWWLGTSFRGLIHYFPNAHSLKVINLPNKSSILPYGGAVSNLREFGNYLFFLSGKALYRYDRKNGVFKKLSQKPIERSLILQKDKFWVVLKDKTIASYTIQDGLWMEYDLNPLFLDDAHELGYSFVDNRGRFGILSDREGVFFFNEALDRFEVWRNRKGKNPEFITFNSFVIPDKSGNLWLYGKDIVKIDLKTLESKTLFETERIGHALIDHNNNHWLALYNRYTQFNPKTNHTKQFDLPFGVDNAEYYTRIFELRNGNILSCQKGNLIELLPDKLNLKTPVGRILLDKISLIDSSFLIHKDSTIIKLNYDQNTFTISHGIIKTFDEPNYQYYYQLRGYSDEWIPTNSGSTSFTNLSGGDYEYTIKAKNEDGEFTATRTLFLHLDTIFYKTIWFKLLMGLASVYVFLAFFRYRTNQRKQIHHLQIQSTRLEKDKTEIQYQNLINHLNPHFLFNSLTSLNGLILSEPDLASDFLQKLSKTYRYILQNKENELVSLKQEINFVKNYIDLQKARFEEGLQVNFDIEDRFLSYRIVPVTLQNLFENAIKHNTIEEERPLVIKVLVENEYLIVKNNLQKKKFVETSNKQGLDSLINLYKYLISKPFEVNETDSEFIVKVPLI